MKCLACIRVVLGKDAGPRKTTDRLYKAIDTRGRPDTHFAQRYQSSTGRYSNFVELPFTTHKHV